MTKPQEKKKKTQTIRVGKYIIKTQQLNHFKKLLSGLKRPERMTKYERLCLND